MSDEPLWDNGKEEYQKLKAKRYLNLEKMLAGELERANNEGRHVMGR